MGFHQFLTFLLLEIKTISPNYITIFKTEIPRPCPKSTESESPGSKAWKSVVHRSITNDSNKLPRLRPQP